MKNLDTSRIQDLRSYTIGEDNYTIVRINSDGNCLFSAIAEAYAHFDAAIPRPSYCNSPTQLRAKIVEVLQAPEYQHLIKVTLSSEREVPIETITLQDVNNYYQRMATNSTWAGTPELEALARILTIKIIVINAMDPEGSQTLTFPSEHNSLNQPRIHLIRENVNAGIMPLTEATSSQANHFNLLLPPDQAQQAVNKLKDAYASPRFFEQRKSASTGASQYDIVKTFHNAEEKFQTIYCENSNYFARRVGEFFHVYWMADFFSNPGDDNVTVQYSFLLSGLDFNHVQQVFFSQESRRLYLVSSITGQAHSNSQTITMADAKGQTSTFKIGYQILECCVSNSGNKLALLGKKDGKPVISVYQTADFKLLYQLEHPELFLENIARIIFSQDEQAIYYVRDYGNYRSSKIEKWYLALPYSIVIYESKQTIYKFLIDELNQVLVVSSTFGHEHHTYTCALQTYRSLYPSTLPLKTLKFKLIHDPRQQYTDIFFQLAEVRKEDPTALKVNYINFLKAKLQTLLENNVINEWQHTHKMERLEQILSENSKIKSPYGYASVGFDLYNYETLSEFLQTPLIIITKNKIHSYYHGDTTPIFYADCIYRVSKQQSSKLIAVQPDLESNLQIIKALKAEADLKEVKINTKALCESLYNNHELHYIHSVKQMTFIPMLSAKSTLEYKALILTKHAFSIHDLTTGNMELNIPISTEIQKVFYFEKGFVTVTAESICYYSENKAYKKVPPQFTKKQLQHQVERVVLAAINRAYTILRTKIARQNLESGASHFCIQSPADWFKVVGHFYTWPTNIEHKKEKLNRGNFSLKIGDSSDHVKIIVKDGRFWVTFPEGVSGTYPSISEYLNKLLKNINNKFHAEDIGAFLSGKFNRELFENHRLLAEVLLFRLQGYPYDEALMRQIIHEEHHHELRKVKHFLDSLLTLLIVVEGSNNHFSLISTILLLDLIRDHAPKSKEYQPYTFTFAFMQQGIWDLPEAIRGHSKSGDDPSAAFNTGRGNYSRRRDMVIAEHSSLQVIKNAPLSDHVLKAEVELVTDWLLWFYFSELVNTDSANMTSKVVQKIIGRFNSVFGSRQAINPESSFHSRVLFETYRSTEAMLHHSMRYALLVTHSNSPSSSSFRLHSTKKPCEDIPEYIIDGTPSKIISGKTYRAKLEVIPVEPIGLERTLPYPFINRTISIGEMSILFDKFGHIRVGGKVFKPTSFEFQYLKNLYPKIQQFRASFINRPKLYKFFHELLSQDRTLIENKDFRDVFLRYVCNHIQWQPHPSSLNKAAILAIDIQKIITDYCSVLESVKAELSENSENYLDLYMATMSEFSESTSCLLSIKALRTFLKQYNLLLFNSTALTYLHEQLTEDKQFDFSLGFEKTLEIKINAAISNYRNSLVATIESINNRISEMKRYLSGKFTFDSKAKFLDQTKLKESFVLAFHTVDCARDFFEYLVNCGLFSQRTTVEFEKLFETSFISYMDNLKKFANRTTLGNFEISDLSRILSLNLKGFLTRQAFKADFKERTEHEELFILMKSFCFFPGTQVQFQNRVTHNLERYTKVLEEVLNFLQKNQQKIAAEFILSLLSLTKAPTETVYSENLLNEIFTLQLFNSTVHFTPGFEPHMNKQLNIPFTEEEFTALKDSQILLPLIKALFDVNPEFSALAGIKNSSHVPANFCSTCFDREHYQTAFFLPKRGIPCLTDPITGLTHNFQCQNLPDSETPGLDVKLINPTLLGSCNFCPDCWIDAPEPTKRKRSTHGPNASTSPAPKRAKLLLAPHTTFGAPSKRKRPNEDSDSDDDCLQANKRR